MPKKHILICDDENPVRESLKAYLEKDYDLTFATNGHEALESIKSKDFDLFITDIKMPSLDGIDTIRQINQSNPNQKIIVLTGYESMSVAQEANKYNISSYLTKPVSKDKLLKTITNILE